MSKPFIYIFIIYSFNASPVDRFFSLLASRFDFSIRNWAGHGHISLSPTPMRQQPKSISARFYQNK
jgi:hypothetical protein